MVMQGYDVSNWQSGYSTDWLIRTSDFLIMKATEGLDFVDGYCDGWVQACRRAGHPWGFYHFARNNDPIAEADFFVDDTANYFGEGIPVLDWEDGQSVAWVNAFVERVHSRTGIWPWIYANPWRFQLGGVNENCGRWVASYPGGVPSPQDCPAADGVPVCCWQYTSTPLDKNYFYGDEEAWYAYVRGDAEGGTTMPEEVRPEAAAVWQYAYGDYTNPYVNTYNMLAECYHMLTRNDDPTGGTSTNNMYDHIKWIARVLNDNGAAGDSVTGMLRQCLAQLSDINDRLDALEQELFEEGE